MEFHILQVGKTSVYSSGTKLYNPLTKILIEHTDDSGIIGVTVTQVEGERASSLDAIVANGDHRKIDINPQQLQFIQAATAKREQIKGTISYLRSEESNLLDKVYGIIYDQQQ